MANKTTPMMAQWHECKKQAGEALLLFRMGDFYEAFYDDAVDLSQDLELTLTKRQGIPMAGVPWHSSTSYIDRLIAKGHRVAIAEQMEDPAKTKGLVQRQVVRVITPGTTDSVPEKSNNYFAAIAQQGSIFGLAAIDLTTAEFSVCEFENERELWNELCRLRPVEFLVSDKTAKLLEPLKPAFEFLTNVREHWHFDHQMAYRCLTRHFEIHSLDGLGLKGMIAAINAAGALLTYLTDELHLSIAHIRHLAPYSPAEFLALDQTTQRNLELTENLRDGGRRGTLLDVLDETQTAMGGRLLRRWLKRPLLSTEKIRERQREVERLPDQLTPHLGKIRDLERLMMKISTGIAIPRDFVALRYSLEQLPHIRPLVSHTLEDVSEIALQINHTLDEEGAFREGFNAKLDELRNLTRNGKKWLADYQEMLREQTGIKTLKVGYNRIFGYYIEVSRGQADRVPDTFLRRQTLTQSERFIDPKLKSYETKVLTAEEEITSLEQELFSQLRSDIAKANDRILHLAHTLAEIDCLNSLAQVARQRKYVCPTVDDSSKIEIKEGRHPVVEMGPNGFVPNDTHLDNQLALITGPNMAGKSTYIRQVALITLMAQIGSFVPAASARIGVVDKIFTRIGASDDLSRGQSTFMVEMAETANILHNATDKSLVILDEIGRGTSTYDGVSIAWAVAEHLLGTKTLFATHYWELTELEGALNYNVAIEENEGEIVFLHKIVPGSADKSYGIHVARLAGIPLPVIDRAQEILHHLEGSNKEPLKTPAKMAKEIQLSLF